MHGLENLRVFHADGRQRIDVEKPAIIDLVRGDSPVTEPIRLLIQESFEAVEAFRLPAAAVEVIQRSGQGFAHLAAGVQQHAQPPPRDILFAVPLLHGLRGDRHRARANVPRP